MNDASTIQIISLIGWLILAGSAFASYQLSWRKGLTIALTWVAIFGAVFVVFSWAGV